MVNAIVEDLRRLEYRYSRYRPDSFLSEINRVAMRGESIRVDHETAGLINYASTCYQQSDGLFDITAGVLRQVWRFDEEKLPTPHQIETILSKVGWYKLNWTTPILSFLTPGMEIDMGGIVKEYAADRAASLSIEMGIKHGFVNLGGDIRVIGPHPDGSPWRIGIRHPHDKNALLQTISLSTGAIASSGDYERFIMIDGKRYGHILNPKTGWPVGELSAVTVVADYCVIAGSACTIAMLKESRGPGWLDSLGLQYVWIDCQGNKSGPLSNDHKDA